MEWRPVGVKALEAAAEAVVRSTKSHLVVAGPGAGKTELLAQRACYLLQAGACSFPGRILAISFKKDAARNLYDRVALRCGRELASRFESYTFDSFAKSLVDRFLVAVPEPFRPSADYVLKPELLGKQAKEIVVGWSSQESVLSPSERHYLNRKQLWESFINRDLPVDGVWDNRSRADTAAGELWEHLLNSGEQSVVNFPMIGRVASLMLEANPAIVAALQRAYGHVFIDEYQDTTRVQYSIVRHGFMGSDAVLTAVGDAKQRIMGWAGAMEKAFDAVVADFGATRVDLTCNYRSTPRLVAVQNVVARALDKTAAAVRAMRQTTEVADECRVLEFASDDAEAECLAEMIATWMTRDGLAPRDICVLCRMKESGYTSKLMDSLATRGVRARIERELQDLLSEPLVECLLDALRLSCRERDAEAWLRMLALLESLESADDRVDERRRMDRLTGFGRQLASSLSRNAGQEAVVQILNRVMAFVGEEAFRAAHSQYAQGNYYERVLTHLAEYLVEALARAEDWSDAVADVEGNDSVPVMTTHKSKGLEYHTVVFVGLEDGAYWGFGDNPVEEMCGFFVALSRAKARALFTFCADRGGQQSRQAIEAIYKLMEEAGVAVERVE